MTNQDWWRDFFFELWPRIQEGGYPAERTAAECDLIQNALGLENGSTVLDIPCGIGRHTIELARRGFELTGVDFNPAFISSAEADAISAGVSPRFLTCDMRDFSTVKKFDAAFCYFGSFGYFSEEEDEKFVHAVAESLRPGGRFLIQGHIGETLLPIFRERDWFWVETPTRRVRLLEERSWRIETGRIESNWTFIDESSIESSTTSMRIYMYRELRDLLRRAGFSSVDLLDGKTGQEFRMGCRNAIVVAERGT